MIEHDHRLEIQGPGFEYRDSDVSSTEHHSAPPLHYFRFFMILTIVLEHTALDATFTSD